MTKSLLDHVDGTRYIEQQVAEYGYCYVDIDGTVVNQEMPDDGWYVSWQDNGEDMFYVRLSDHEVDGYHVRTDINELGESDGE